MTRGDLAVQGPLIFVEQLIQLPAKRRLEDAKFKLARCVCHDYRRSDRRVRHRTRHSVVGLVMTREKIRDAQEWIVLVVIAICLYIPELVATSLRRTMLRLIIAMIAMIPVSLALNGMIEKQRQGLAAQAMQTGQIDFAIAEAARLAQVATIILMIQWSGYIVAALMVIGWIWWSYRCSRS